MPWQNHGNSVINNFPSTLCCRCCFCAISKIFLYMHFIFSSIRIPWSPFCVLSLPWIIRNFLELCGATSKLSAQSASPTHLPSLSLFSIALFSFGLPFTWHMSQGNSDPKCIYRWNSIKIRVHSLKLFNHCLKYYLSLNTLTSEF